MFRCEMGFWTAAEAQVRPIAVLFHTDHHAARTEMTRIRLRQVLLYGYPEVFVTEETEFIKTIVCVIRSNGLRCRLVCHY